MSDGWVQKANSQYQTHEPVLLRLTKNTQTVSCLTDFFSGNFQKKKKGYSWMFVFKGSITTFYYTSDFDESGLDEFQFRITDCYDKSRQKHFMFRLPSTLLLFFMIINFILNHHYLFNSKATNRDIMEQYKTNLKNSVLLALVEGMAVQPIRIQDLKVSCFCLFLSDIELFLIEGKTNCNCKDRF